MKKIAASDSRQSVGLKWKLRKGLDENVAFKEDGTMEVGKNLKVDGTLTLNTPEDLAFKTGAISSEPEGYSVDGEGNVTIAGALTANNNGDVEVSNKLKVDGNTLYLAGDLVRIRSYIEGSFYNFRVEIKDRNFANSYKTGLELELSDTGYWYCYVGGQKRILTENEAEKRYSKSRYQHTVTIKGTRPSQGGGSCLITFTAYSSKNTIVDSAQDLIDVFGGCKLSVSGMYSPAQGTNFGALRLMLEGASTIDDASLGYIDPGITNEAGVKMSECGNLSFTDNVCIPK